MSEWTKTPPTESGWYWWKVHEGYVVPRQIFQDGSVVQMPRHLPDGKWWTTKIEEPK